MKKLLAAVPLIFIAFTSCGIKPEKCASRTITVAGTGTVDIENQKAVISLSVITRSANILSATEENAKKTEAVQKAVEELGIGKENITTSSFHIQQESSYSNGRTILGQYVVSNSLNILIPSIEKTGPVIDGAVRAGANQFRSLTFSAGETTDAEKQARILALRNAEQKAVTLASTSGCSVAKILSIKESPAFLSEASSNLMYSDIQTAKGYSTPVSGGKTSVSVNVEVVYEIQ
ncbi:SIMPL domain-containing protein [Treponema sp.]|uniref:SIMPL domain-containing protein n=1 Tax=Treponema sp. TaxID=166 RepID=UPI003EFE2E52